MVLPGEVQGGLSVGSEGVVRIGYTTYEPDVGSVYVNAFSTARSPFAFTGFFPPVDNNGVLNYMKAGAAVPVKFSLSGDRGLEIMAAGFPASRTVTCDTSDRVDAVEQTVASGASSLSYDVAADTCTDVWKSDKAWTNTCRELNTKLTDGTEDKTYFKFSK